jgi:hypothetical protein
MTFLLGIMERTRYCTKCYNAFKLFKASAYNRPQRQMEYFQDQLIQNKT